MNHTSEDHTELLARNEQDALEALERDPELSNWHQARGLESYFSIHKQMDSEGSWAGLWTIKSRIGPLPQELQGSFTDQQTAINAIKKVLELKNKEKEIQNDQ